MEENKVTLSLEEYLKLYDTKKQIEQNIKELIDYLFEIGLEIEKSEAVFDRYNLSNERMKKMLINIDKERFEAQEKAMKEDE